MDVYAINDLEKLLRENRYVGRSIIVGTTPDAKHAAFAYFIMGRSQNSRNRIFVEKDGAVFTRPFDASKVEDPSLIIYAAVRKARGKTVVTNGDQTDTVVDALKAGKTFADALKGRTFEPDAPNFTPRISAMLDFDGGFKYSMSILKSADEKGGACCRFLYEYPSVPGLGHFLHTYVCDGNPLPSFSGEPERISTMDDIDDFARLLWTSLDKDNKISLYVRYTRLSDGKEENRLFNKDKQEKKNERIRIEVRMQPQPKARGHFYARRQRSSRRGVKRTSRIYQFSRRIKRLAAGKRIESRNGIGGCDFV